jgi:hypothetical protein
MATLSNLHIVQNGSKWCKPQTLHFGVFVCESQDFKLLTLLVFAGGPAFFNFGPLELWFSGLFFEKISFQLSHKRHLI